MQINAILFAATAVVVATTAQAVENKDEPDDVAAAHTAEIHTATAAVQEKQEPDDVAGIASATVAVSVCKEIHYVPPKYFLVLQPTLPYAKHRILVILNAVR